jgi:hypothetical protein
VLTSPKKLARTAFRCPAAARWGISQQPVSKSGRGCETATEARTHLLHERGLEVAVERLLTLMTNGAPFARNTSATE